MVSSAYHVKRCLTGLSIIGVVAMFGMALIYSATSKYQRAVDGHQIVDGIVMHFLLGTIWADKLQRIEPGARAAHIERGREILALMQRDLYELCHTYRDITPRTAEIFDAPRNGEKTLVKFVGKMRWLVKAPDHQDIAHRIEDFSSYGRSDALVVTEEVAYEFGRYMKQHSGKLAFVSLIAGALMLCCLAFVWINVFRPMRQAITDSQEQLRTALNLADSANVAKDKFLEQVSHQLRTPLNGISGPVSLISKWTLAAPERELIDALERSVARLLRVCKQTLDYVDVGAGSTTPRHVTFKPEALLSESAEGESRRAGRPVQMQTAWHGAPNIERAGPLDFLHVVLANLVDNARRHARGTARIEGWATLSADDEGQCCALVCAVSDDGPGFPQGDRERIFERFEKHGSHRQGDDPGIGLGLTICRELMERMGGTIEIGTGDLGGALVSIAVRLPVTQSRAAENSGDHELWAA